jgi:viologen exporter family transport system permease protein
MLRAWCRTASITTLGEILSPARITAGAIRLGMQVLLAACLWRALYVTKAVSGGVTREQAVTYAVIAVLMMRIRTANRFYARDSITQHVQYGTIVYWYLRPLSAQRYYLLREVGDQLYGCCWAAVGYGLGLATGIISYPSSAEAAEAFAVSMLLGQSVLYYITLLTDQVCFWTVKNASTREIIVFARNLLSGGFAAIWFFPHWFQDLSAFLPFEYTMGVPISFYIGKSPPGSLPMATLPAFLWIGVLAVVTRLVWIRAGERVVSQGG